MAKTKNIDPLDKILEFAGRVPAPQQLTALRAGAETALSKQLFFVCGAIKSGTTWLQLMLDAHPEITCRGEGHLVNYLLPSLGKALQKYNKEIRLKNNSIFKEIKGFPRFGTPHHFALFQSAVGLLLAHYDRENIRFIGEKTPDNVLYLPSLGRLFPNAQFLHVIRDGRDCAVSGWFHNLRISKEWAESEFGDFAAFAEHYAQGWAKNLRAGREFGARNSERYCEIRYEDLLSGGDSVEVAPSPKLQSHDVIMPPGSTERSSNGTTVPPRSIAYARNRSRKIWVVWPWLLRATNIRCVAAVGSNSNQRRPLTWVRVPLSTSSKFGSARPEPSLTPVSDNQISKSLTLLLPKVPSM